MISPTIQVFEALKKKIQTGEYPPGKSLPEQALAKEFGVSRNTVKKALLMLEQVELVTVEVNRGAFVRKHSFKEIIEYMEIRAIIEVIFCRIAAATMNEYQILAMSRITQKLKSSCQQQDSAEFQKNLELFHMTLAEACTNRSAVSYYKRMVEKMNKFDHKYDKIPGRWQEIVEEHEAILDCIKKHDQELAEKAMYVYMNNSIQVLKDHVDLYF